MSSLHSNVYIQHMEEMVSSAWTHKSILIWSAAVNNKRLRYLCKYMKKKFFLNKFSVYIWLIWLQIIKFPIKPEKEEDLFCRFTWKSNYKTYLLKTEKEINNFPDTMERIRNTTVLETLQLNADKEAVESNTDTPTIRNEKEEDSEDEKGNVS